MTLDQILEVATGALMPRWTDTRCNEDCCWDTTVSMKQASVALAEQASREALSEGARIRVRKDRVIVTNPDMRGEDWSGVQTCHPVAVFLLPRS